MRRKDWEVTKEQGFGRILESCDVCRIAMKDEEGLYIVPMNFGYVYEEGKLTLYFHSAKEGRKLDAIKANPQVAFEMDCGHRLVEGKTACEYGFSFSSIIGNGMAQVVTDVEEKKKALSLLMEHQVGKAFTFSEKQAESVAVIKVTADRFTGKHHP